jgi:hypothetical protein
MTESLERFATRDEVATGFSDIRSEFRRLFAKQDEIGQRLAAIEAQD